MRVVDSFDAIRPIMSRFSMLAPLDKDGIRLQVGLHARQLRHCQVWVRHY